MNRARVHAGFTLLLTMLTSLMGGAQTHDTLVVREALGITLPRRTVSSVIAYSPLDGWFTRGRAHMPQEGESVHFADGTSARWERIVSDNRGWFPEKPSSEQFVAVTIKRESASRMVLEGMGHDFVFVNGVPRAGNPYQQKDERESWEPRFDYSRIPVDLVKGENLLLFRYSRGRLKIRLLPVARPVAFNPGDVTLPDAQPGAPLDSWGSILLVNATGSALKGLSLVSAPSGGDPDTIGVAQVPPVGVRKVPFRIRLKAPAAKGEIPLRLTLLQRKGLRRTAVDTATITLRVVGSGEPYRETFVSSIDGSVQYYAVMPPRAGDTPGAPALFLSLHGAGVEALNQAASYSPKSWGYIVAPTNRRPYGFSWEDWGRLDALEVLDLVTKKYECSEGRIYLTGHSMGGHGTWFLGATYPDRFAAIGPSAGWITFQTYRFAGVPEESTAVQHMLRRAAAPSDLFALADNYRHFGLYILHGSKDDNVPPEQSHMMIDRIKARHRDFEYWEEPGAGHWWDVSPEPGTDCVDWMPMFDFFARHIRPGNDRIRSIEFCTENPGISSRDGWLTIDAQQRMLSLSAAQLHVDPGLNRVQGTTANVARLALDRKILDIRRNPTVELDSQKIAVRFDHEADGRIWFENAKGAWRQVATPSAAHKGAQRYGTFKEVFRNRMALVYGTRGDREENHWAFARARYDAEKLWYQGNGSVDVLADSEFVPSAESERNVVLYGNSQTNRLWKVLLPDCPIALESGRVDLGGRVVRRRDVCCIFVHPRPGSHGASVGVVGGTGLEGMMLSNVVRYLEPGLGLPDLTAFDSDVLTRGDRGVILTGFFGLDWSMTRGEFVSGQ